MRWRRTLTMATLILAGESIYTLPYYLRRDYGKVLTDVLEISQTQLGWLSSMFGVFALLCYLPGGWLADRRSPRGLLTVSLVATGCGGLALLTQPSFEQLVAIYGVWGVTTILTFWGALIKATRAWGGIEGQGQAFAWLDGGRGLVGAGLASVAVLVFARASTSHAGLQAVIGVYTAVVFAVGVMCWSLLRGVGEAQTHNASAGRTVGLGAVLRRPTVPLHAVIIVCAYSAYWATFDIARFAADAYHYADAQGASVRVVVEWLRFPASLGAGLVADRLGVSRTIALVFALLLAVFGSTALTPPDPAHAWMLWVPSLLMGVGAFALRGIYFALLAEARLPQAMTGLAVGIISLVGYTPDIFVPPITGWLLDTYPGALGHRIYFAMTGLVCFVGLFATVGFRRVVQIERGGDNRPNDTDKIAHEQQTT